MTSAKSSRTRLSLSSLSVHVPREHKKPPFGALWNNMGSRRAVSKLFRAGRFAGFGDVLYVLNCERGLLRSSSWCARSGICRTRAGVGIGRTRARGGSSDLDFMPDVRTELRGIALKLVRRSIIVGKRVVSI